MTRVAIIGPGRVGTALALALPEPYGVVAVAGGRTASQEALRTRLPDVALVPPGVAGREAELILLCVPDDVLADLARDLARADAVAEGSCWVHTSGAHGADVLRPLALAGARVAACHPAQTFPDLESALARLPGSAWAVTVAEPDVDWAERLVRDLRGVPVRVAEGDRTLYHAALALGANGTAAIVALARDLLLGAGITAPDAFLQPLTTAAAAAAAAHGPAGLTGPVRRGDAGTVARHLAELRVVMPEAVEAYVALSRLALAQARRAGLAAPAADAVRRVLEAT